MMTEAERGLIVRLASFIGENLGLVPGAAELITEADQVVTRAMQQRE